MKTFNLTQLKQQIQNYKQQNKKIVWTNGCFDLLHSGHLHFLKKAKQQGDILIVGLDSDNSIRQLKGSTRPIIQEQQRAEALEALEFVDYILIIQFGEIKTILQELKPNIYAKSNTTKLCNISKEEQENISQHTKEIIIPNEISKPSTTKLIQKITNQTLFNKSQIKTLPLCSRQNKLSIQEIAINPKDSPQLEYNPLIEKIAKEIIKAKNNNKPIIISFGAHLIKNGLSLVLKKFIEKNYVTHLATNGAGSIHDWEFAFQGKSTEDVEKYVNQGQFGIWEETGKYINLAIILGALKNKGYGESISEMINNNKLTILSNLPNNIKQKLTQQNIFPNQTININHPYKNYSIQYSAYKNNIPFTIHPGFGYDIIYTHPLNDGASIGKTSEIDFLKFVNSISNLEGGVYISIGSAIMSPMIFEKALSMARNTAKQENKEIKDFMIIVNDIQQGNWDWNSKEEPNQQDPAYYLRFCKTFHRMGAREMHYIQQDNRDFLLGLYFELERLEN
ncbi:adenylyltransferase/cytidyltransferase family protein [archaeon]|jgi:rfaE bifunctional protein nucleotidyltransferase chain/domain|nr:adenylyltransferase/cytidyltransferase family protein [archaeon]